MGKIKPFNLRKVLVDELGSFARGVLTSIKTLLAGKQIPEPLVVGLEQAIKTYEVGAGSKVDKAATERSATFDRECDDLIQAIKGAVRMARHRTPELQVAAQRVEDAIRNRGWNMQNSAYDAESNNIKLLLADFRASPELQSDSVLLGFDDLLVLLEAANKKFDHSEEQRKAKELALGGVNSSQAVDGLYPPIGQVFDYLNSVSAIYPEVATAIDQINLLIDPLAAKIKARATIAKNKKESPVPPKK